MNILAEARRILSAAGYTTLSGKADDTFNFEDQTLLGFVWQARSTAELLNSWQKKQDEFLSDRDRALRKAKDKSWNVYSVALTEEESSQDQLAELARIEEDFGGTRKIARNGIRSTLQITRALLPVLPIQNSLSLGDIDATVRLRARLSSIHEKVAKAFLEPTSIQNAIDVILDADENT